MPTERIRLSDTKRRGVIASTALPTPRAAGRILNLKIKVYDAGHSTINTLPATAAIVCSDDLELVSQLALIVRKMRRARVTQ